MTDLQLIGVGTWSSRHGNWPEFRAGVASGDWPDEVKLQPELIPPRERRRAPQFVKMAIEVMDQACKMANLAPDDVAVVFSSVMGDMQITDYMCTALAQTPELVSPTRFHNSVHNAAAGFWSITTGAFCPASAVSASEFTSTMALLEACVQVAEEETPVLCVTQEVTAPLALMDTCPSEAPFAAAFLLAPAGFSKTPLAELRFELEQTTAQWPLIDRVPAELASNMSARLLPLLVSLSMGQDADLHFPLNHAMSLALHLR